MYIKQLLFIIVFQCIMEYVFRTINRCDERLAFQGGVAAVQCWPEYCKVCMRPGWLISCLSRSVLFLRDDLKDLRPLLLKRVLLIIDKKIKR